MTEQAPYPHMSVGSSGLGFYLTCLVDFGKKYEAEHKKAASYVPNDTPEHLRNLIRRCLSVEPQKRPTFEEICQELETEN